MNNRRYTWILYLIIVVIICTIGIQVYWNYKNYLNNKQQFINEVQHSLDNAVDSYYANLAKETTVELSLGTNNSKETSSYQNERLDSIVEIIHSKHNLSNQMDSISMTTIKGVSIFNNMKDDSLLNSLQMRGSFPKRLNIYTSRDSLKTDQFKALTTKIMVSMANDLISLNAIDTLLQDELKRKKITIDYLLHYKDRYRSTDYASSQNSQNNNVDKIAALRANSKSSFLPLGSALTLYFSN